jgi:glycosyltransferase involved in cell wall biosynthesis
VVVGTGTEYDKLEAWYNDNVDLYDNFNVTVMKGLPKEDYDMLVKYCDVGLIFLDHRFTIPNYPSRLLSYLEYKMPVVCATDVNTDIGRIAEENGYGYWCESVKPEDFTALVDKMLVADRKAMGEKGYQFLKENYLVEHTYNVIMRHLKP